MSSSSVVIRQTPQPIELVSMCPGMDLVAVSFTAGSSSSSTTASSDSSSNKNNNKSFSVYVFRTRPEQQLSGDDADVDANKEQNGEKEQQQNNNNMTLGEDHDGTVKNNSNNKNKSNSNSDHLSMLNTPPIYAYTIKGGSTKNNNNNNTNRITSLQWAPAGGRILCISTLDQIHIVHVELQSLLRVHDLSLLPQQTTTTTQDHERNPHCLLNTANDSSPTAILATTWTRLPLHDTALGSPFPVSKILACENCGIPSSSSNSNTTSADSTTTTSSSTSFSPQLLELAESEWSNGQASVLFVALSNGSLCVLLGGLMLFSVLNGKTTTTSLYDVEKNSNSTSTLFVGPFHSNQNQFAAILSSPSSVHQLISSSSPSSSPLSQIINNSVSIHSRLICQSREILLKLKSDLRDAQAYWTKTVSKVLEKGLPQIMWNYRHEILASMINGQVVRRLMERKELEQSGVVAAAEMLRDTSCTLMKSVVDVAFECIGVLSDHAAVLVKNNKNKNHQHQHQIDDLVAALRDEVSTWVRQVSIERELLSSVLRWLHHYIGSIRSAVIFEEELAMRQDPNNNNQPPPTPPPSVSHVEANDHLVAFDFLSAIVDDEEDEENEKDSSPSSSPAMPSSIRSNLLRVASSVQHHAQVLLDQLSSSSSSSSDGGDNSNNFSWSNKLQIASLQSLLHLAVSCTSFGAASSHHQYPHALSYDIQHEMGMMMMSVSSDGGNTSNNKNVMPRCVNISELSTTGSSSDADYFACDYQPQEDCLELFNLVVGSEDNGDDDMIGDDQPVASGDTNSKNKSSKIVYVQRSRFSEFNEKKNHGAPSQSAKFATEFAPPPATTTSSSTEKAQPIIRFFPNAQRDTLAVVKGKRIQCLDITIEEDFDDDDDDNDES